MKNILQHVHRDEEPDHRQNTQNGYVAQRSRYSLSNRQTLRCKLALTTVIVAAHALTKIIAKQRSANTGILARHIRAIVDSRLTVTIGPSLNTGAPDIARGYSEANT